MKGRTLLLGLASLLVPSDRRADWLEEWRAELAAGPGGGQKVRVLDVLGAFADAWQLRREEWTMDGLLRDASRALRGFRRAPAFTLTACLTLGLGIGANAALFSVVNSVLLRPLPYRDPGALVRVDAVMENGNRAPLSRPDWRDWREVQPVFSGFASYLPVTSEAVLGGSQATNLRVRRVSADFFETLGVAAALGRTFGPEEEGLEPPARAVISYAAWERLLGAPSDLAGLRLDLLGQPHDVLGVMPPGFTFIEDTDVWVLHEREDVWEVRWWPTFGTVARLRPGVSVERARVELDAVAASHRAGLGSDTPFTHALIAPFQDWLVGSVRGTLLTLLAAAAVVLLVACTNVASTLLARARARAGEVAVRRALGASRGRVVRELLTEAVVLAVVSAAGGMVVARGALALVRGFGSGRVPRLGEVTLDGTVAAFSVALALAAVPLFALGPALSATRAHVARAVRSKGHQRASVWSAFICVEVAAATLLLVGAGLLVRSIFAIHSVPLGWDPRDLLTVEVSLPPSRYPAPADAVSVHERMLEQLEAIPGVAAVGATTRLPTTPDEDSAPIWSRERGFEQAAYGGLRAVSPGYLDALGVPLISGRSLETGDADPAAPGAALITETVARRLWPDENPIGRTFRHNNDLGAEGELMVVGVVGEARHWSRTPGLQPEVYVSFRQRGQRLGSWTYVLRAPSRTAEVVAAVRDRLSALDPEIPYSVRPMDERFAATYQDRRFSLALLGAFAVLAATLAVVGVAGVVAYAIERRTREIGIRLALGEGPGRIRRRIQSGVLGPAVLGVAAGGIAAYVLTRTIRALLFGIEASDPLTYASVALLVLSAVWVTGTVPGRRATRLDPVRVLRAE